MRSAGAALENDGPGPEPAQVILVNLALLQLQFKQCRRLGEHQRVGTAGPSGLVDDRQFVRVDPDMYVPPALLGQGPLESPARGIGKELTELRAQIWHVQVPGNGTDQSPGSRAGEASRRWSLAWACRASRPTASSQSGSGATLKTFRSTFTR